MDHDQLLNAFKTALNRAQTAVKFDECGQFDDALGYYEKVRIGGYFSNIQLDFISFDYGRH